MFLLAVSFLTGEMDLRQSLFDKLDWHQQQELLFDNFDAIFERLINNLDDVSSLLSHLEEHGHRRVLERSQVYKITGFGNKLRTLLTAAINQTEVKLWQHVQHYIRRHDSEFVTVQDNWVSDTSLSVKVCRQEENFPENEEKARDVLSESHAEIKIYLPENEKSLSETENDEIYTKKDQPEAELAKPYESCRPKTISVIAHDGKYGKSGQKYTGGVKTTGSSGYSEREKTGLGKTSSGYELNVHNRPISSSGSFIYDEGHHHSARAGGGHIEYGTTGREGYARDCASRQNYVSDVGHVADYEYMYLTPIPPPRPVEIPEQVWNFIKKMYVRSLRKMEKEYKLTIDVQCGKSRGNVFISLFPESSKNIRRATRELRDLCDGVDRDFQSETYTATHLRDRHHHIMETAKLETRAMYSNVIIVRRGNQFTFIGEKSMPERAKDECMRLVGDRYAPVDINAPRPLMKTPARHKTSYTVPGKVFGTNKKTLSESESDDLPPLYEEDQEKAREYVWNELEKEAKKSAKKTGKAEKAHGEDDEENTNRTGGYRSTESTWPGGQRDNNRWDNRDRANNARGDSAQTSQVTSGQERHTVQCEGGRPLPVGPAGGHGGHGSATGPYQHSIPPSQSGTRPPSTTPRHGGGQPRADTSKMPPTYEETVEDYGTFSHRMKGQVCDIRFHFPEGMQDVGKNFLPNDEATSSLSLNMDNRGQSIYKLLKQAFISKRLFEVTPGQNKCHFSPFSGKLRSMLSEESYNDEDLDELNRQLRSLVSESSLH